MTITRELRWLRPAILATLRGEAPPAAPELGPADGLVLQLREAGGEIRASVGRSRLAGGEAPEGDGSRARPGDAALELIEALLEDPRSPPLREEELAALRIELWLLGAERRLESGELFDPRAEALRVQRGHQSALLLPDTPADWDARAALAYACRLAGLEGRAFEQPETLVWVRNALCHHDDAEHD